MNKSELPHLEKMYLLNQNTFEHWQQFSDEAKQLSLLDKNISHILNQKKLTSMRKFILYKEFLEKYLKFKHFLHEVKREQNKTKSTKQSGKNDDAATVKQTIEFDNNSNMDDIMQHVRENPEILKDQNLMDIDEVIGDNNNNNNKADADDIRMIELSNIPNTSIARFDQSSQRQLKRKQKQQSFDSKLIAEMTIDDRLNRLSKSKRMKFEEANGKKVMKKIHLIAADGNREYVLNLHRALLTLDNHVQAEDNHGALTTINGSEINPNDLNSIRNYLVEKHFQLTTITNNNNNRIKMSKQTIPTLNNISDKNANNDNWMKKWAHLYK